MRIEIICTGDEVLTGKIVNTNFSYMSQKLEDVGLSVHWGTTVGDDRESLLAAFQLAAQRADAVIVNGGLGPTVDDLIPSTRDPTMASLMTALSTPRPTTRMGRDIARAVRPGGVS